MKRFILSHLFLFLLFGLNISAQDNPVADEAAVVQSGNVRFTILTPRLIRIQYSKPPTEISTSPLFEDRATFAVVNRRLPVPEFTKEERDGYLYITTSALNLKYRIGAAIRPAQHTDAALSITFNLNGRTVLWYPGKDDAFNLKGTMRTLDGDIGDSHRPNFENGLLSRDGWAIVDESPSAKRGDDSRTFAFGEAVDGIPWVEQPVDPNAIDMYFFGYGHDYKDALADYVKIAGRQPMPPRYMFGYWYSKYQRYTADDFRNLVTDINANDIPLDVMIFDMDWHKDGWVVTLAEDRYRFTVDMTKRTLKGELFDAWDELFLVGGAASCGWESYIMLPFTRVEGERCTYTWTGELKNRTENVEPRRFKLTGQNAWEPKHLHPFTQDESPLATTQLRTGGDDTKWQIAADGWYRITVDVFRETFHADYLGRTPTEGQATGINIKHNEECIMHNAPSAIYDLQGRKVASLMNSEERTMNNSLFTNHYSSGQRPNPGIYIIGDKKVVIK